MRRHYPGAVLALTLSFFFAAPPVRALEVKQASTATKINFVLLSSTDHVTPVTGVTPTVTISKNGAAFAAPTGTVAEVGNGWYALTPSAGDSGTTGDLIVHATATGADPADRVAEVVAYDPTNATTLGLANLDAAVSTRSTFAGGAVASVTGSVGSVTGAVASVTSPVTVNAVNGLAPPANWNLTAIDASGRGQVQYGTAAGQVNLSGGNLAGAVPSVSGAVGSVTGGVGGSVVGSVGSVSGAVASVTNPVAVGSYASGQDPATLVLDATASSHNTAGTVGQKISAAGSAADPLNVQVPGSYASGSVGYLIGTNLNATVSSRSTYAGGAVASVTAPVTVGGYSTGQDPSTLVLDVTSSSHNNAGTVGQKINSAGSAGNPWTSDISSGYTGNQAGAILFGNLNATVSSRSTFAGGAVASVTAPVTLASTQAYNNTGQTTKLPAQVGVGDGADAAALRAAYVAPDNTTLGYLSGLLNPGHTAYTAAALANAPFSLTSGGSSYIPVGTVVAGSTSSSVTVSGLTPGRNFVGQHLYHGSGESRLIGSQTYANNNYTFTFTATALLPASFSTITAGDTVRPTP